MARDVDPTPRGRFGFGDLPVGPFRPEPNATSRVTLVAWAHGPDDLSPLFAGSALHPRTIVVRWPTDPDGFLDARRVEHATVCLWELTAALFDELHTLHVDFHLGRHDLLVRPSPLPITPCRDTLRPVLARVPGLDARIRSALSEL